MDYSTIDKFENNILEKRKKDWIDVDLNNISGLPYFKNKSVNQFEWKNFWDEWLYLEKKLFLNIDINKIKISDNQDDFKNNFNEIIKELGWL